MKKQHVVNSECMRGTLLVQLLHPHDPTPLQLLPVSSAQPFPLRPMWPRTRRTTQRQSRTTLTPAKVVCGTQEANKSVIYDGLITLGPMGCLPLPLPLPAAPAGAVGALRGRTRRWGCGTRGVLAADASSAFRVK